MKGVEMVGFAVLTSGALAAGFGFYRYITQNIRAPQPASVPLGSPWGRVTGARGKSQDPQSIADITSEPEAIDLLPRTEESIDELNRGFNSSSISLGLASTGLLFFPPLQYAAVPALIYMGTPAARRAYDLLYEQGRPSRALAETVVLAVCLGGGWYLVGSLGFWLYYLRRIANCRQKAAQLTRAATWALPTLVRVRNGIDEALVPIATLQIGDEVSIATSDIVPVDGVISTGAAWVQPAGTTDASTYRLKRVGDRVMAHDVVIAGRIALRVQRVA